MKDSNCRASMGNNNPFKKKSLLKTLGVSLLGTALSMSVFGQIDASRYGRDIDKRLTNAQLFRTQSPSTAQLQRLETVRQMIPGINARFNQYGVTSSLTNPTGNIASIAAYTGQDPEFVARSFVDDNIDLLGLSPADIQSMQLNDVVKSINGVTHYYFGQTYNGIPVYNGQLQVHVTEQGAISSINNAFVPNLAQAVRSLSPSIDAGQAIAAAAQELNIDLQHEPLLQEQLLDAQSSVTYLHWQLGPEAIKAKLVLMHMAPGEVALAWNFQFQTDNGWPDVTVNADTGELITSFDMMRDAAFKVYGDPVESPIHTNPLPPADARTLVVDPENALASPVGWFDGNSTTMDGNNVHACADANNNNSCDTPEPVCPDQVCDFPIDLTDDPDAYTAAAIANLFYWNNHIHDVQYQYGFNEVAGNFQENNFGRGGSGSDSVNADAQNSGNCNANFATPTDGSNPRMQMFLCDEDNPSRDGDFDNGVIVHEYGHGISIRQVGGPSNSSCLNNLQQGGEGWSDWFGLVYTADAADQGTDARGLGSYLIALPPDGTIRPQRYSTNPAINTYTYESMQGLSIPHGVGSVWAQVLWEMYWVLVDEYGFEGDLINFDLDDPNEAGNKRALFYVNEGLKETSCSPTFVAARDGIIAAVNNSFGGEDVCRVWGAFAAYGLGVDASSGGSNSTNPTNGFSLPQACLEPPEPVKCADGTDPLAVFDFESGAEGWTNAASATCSTGDFVSGSPSLQTNGGVTTQVSGAANGFSAWFTATNTAAGTNDVDGGTCITESPEISVNAGAVDISLSYFHGQRDAGDDATDGFSIEVLNNGTVDSEFVIGDVTSNAAWTTYETTVNNPGDVQLRVSVTDGATGGDLIEGGVDKVVFCATGVVLPTPTPTPSPDPSPVPTPSPSPSPEPSPSPVPGCAVEEGFESGAAGWSSAGSTCTTGDFVVGSPTLQTNGGVTTQVAGANSGSNAFFTATNTSAGVNDVDNGNCVTTSPTYSVTQASTLEIAYFHGQRDSGDDANGDFFELEYSTDGGVTFETLANNGDSASNAAWLTSSASIPAGSEVIVRAACSDGAGPGDLVECGIDDLSICPTP